jgi:bifunctional enzyme CysN/CysC
VIIGSTPAALGLDVKRLKAQGAIVLAVFPDPPAVTGELLKSLAASDIAVLALAGDDFTPAAQHICLLAWHLHGELPIVITASENGEATLTVKAYTEALGAHTAVKAVATELPSALDQASRLITERNAADPFRLSIDSDKVEDTAVSGAVVAGVARPGLEVVLLPQAAPAAIARVEVALEGGANLIIHLDAPVTCEAGQVLAAANARPEHADQVAAHIVWFDEHPLLPGRPYRVRLAGQSTTAQISALKHKINPTDLNPIAARRLERGDVGLCNVSFASPLIFDQAVPGRPAAGGLHRFMIEDPGTGDILGIGQIQFTLRRATNIHWQALAIDKAARAALKDQRPCCLWFTGLSGSGKSTVASLLEKRLNAASRHTYTLDGDNVRHGLNRDLGFTDADRVENIRRIAEVSKLFVDAGLIVMVSFISPFRAERDMARTLFPPGEFLEIYVDTPIDVCEQRDPKGLYKKARAGQLKNFTGIDSPYEPPERAELRLNGGGSSPEALVEQILKELARRGMVDLTL